MKREFEEKAKCTKSKNLRDKRRPKSWLFKCKHKNLDRSKLNYSNKLKELLPTIRVKIVLPFIVHSIVFYKRLLNKENNEQLRIH